MRTEKGLQGAQLLGWVMASLSALPTSDSPVCHFILQNSPLWWLKVKRLWLPRLSTPDPQPPPLPLLSSVAVQFVYVIFYSPLSSFSPHMTPFFWKMLEK